MIQKVVTILVIVVVVLGGGYYAYQQLVPPPVDEAEGPIYATAEVVSGDISVGVTATGPIHPSSGGGLQVPWTRGQQGPGVSYVVDEVLARDSDHVQAGQVVIRLRAPGLEDQIEAKRQEVQSTRESLAELLNVEPGNVHQTNMSQGITLRAPIGGRIIGLNATEGAKLEKDSIVARIVNDSRFTVVAKVTPGNFTKISEGQETKLRFPQYAGSIAGEVVDINPDPVPESRAQLETDCSNPEPSGPADEYTMVYWVTIEADNPGLVQPDMRVQVGFVDGDSTHWAYYCARVEGFGEEQVILSPTGAVATRVYVHDRETVKAGDALVALAGDDARASIREELDRLRQLELELQQLISQRENLEIKAPMGGIISEMRVEANQTVQAGEWLGSVYNTDAMRMWVQVDDVDVVNVQQGAPVIITVDAAPGKEFQGQVTHVSQMGQDQSGVIQFGVNIELVGGPELRPGMQGEAYIDAGSAEDVLLVPLEAIFEEDGQPKVEILKKDGTPKVVAVELGLMNDRVAEVKSGLEEGQLVITGSSADLLPSQTIRGNEIIPDSGDEGDEGTSGGPE